MKLIIWGGGQEKSNEKTNYYILLFAQCPPFLGFIWTASLVPSANQYICCQITKAFDNIILEPLVTEISIIK